MSFSTASINSFISSKTFDLLSDLLDNNLLVKNVSKCLEMKQIAEETSFAYYECAVVDANLKGGKIISINEELEVL